MAACPRCGRENQADARVCDSCGGELAPASRELRKTVTRLVASRS